jgi:16S rRNA (uracil1498-N3)-methyltransferase
MKHRLHLPALEEMEDDATGARLSLDAERAHYLGRVLRLRDGAEIAVFDGQGREWLAQLESASRDGLSVRIDALLRETPAPTPLILAQSWLKGSAMDTVVQKATELGVTGFKLFPAKRSNVKLDARRLDNKLVHLTKVSVSAAEQCGTPWLPALSCHDDLQSVLSDHGLSTTLFLDFDAPPIDAGIEPAPTMLVVGPEGGWADEERSLAARVPGVVTAGLGALTLRAETVPLAALAAIRHDWGWRR